MLNCKRPPAGVGDSTKAGHVIIRLKIPPCAVRRPAKLIYRKGTNAVPKACVVRWCGGWESDFGMVDQKVLARLRDDRQVQNICLKRKSCQDKAWLELKRSPGGKRVMNVTGEKRYADGSSGNPHRCNASLQHAILKTNNCRFMRQTPASTLNNELCKTVSNHRAGNRQMNRPHGISVHRKNNWGS